MTGRYSLRQRLSYAFDRTMSKGTAALIGWLAVASALLVVIFSAVVLIGGFSPKADNGHRPGVFRQLFDSFLHAIDPGTIGNEAIGSNTVRWAFLLLMLAITLGGLFIVSALIGVIATGFDAKLQELRKGRSFVLERDHTLILGWSQNVFTILSELVVANESERKPSVVILADRDKVEMEDAIQAKVKDLGRTRLVVRSGNPIDLDDLAIVNLQAARSIIVLAEDVENPDSQVIKTVLAITQAPDRRPDPYRIVAVISDPDNLEAARLVGGEETIFVDKQETIARIIVQASRQSGASVVYTELLDFAGDEIYFREDPALAGKEFGEALFAYEDCTVIGLAQNGAVALNPPSSRRIEQGVRVVAIAADDSNLAAAKPFSGTIDEAFIALAPPRELRPQRVLLLGWNRRAPAIVNEMDDYVRPGSTMTVVADLAGAEGEIAEHCAGVRNLTVEVRRARTAERRTLEALDVAGYDHVIVLCYEHLDPQEADAQTLITLLHLRELAARSGKQFSIASEMLDDRNRELAQVTKVDDVIVSERVVSLMIAQIAENPTLSQVFSELFVAAGSEIYLRAAGEYVPAGTETNFATIVEAARRRGETAIGYRRAADAGDPDRDYGVRINVPKSERIATAVGDRVVVLAEQ